MQRGFTLIEIVVVVAVVAVLVGLLLPSIQGARESARRVQCQSRLRQIGMAIHDYHDCQCVFPMGCAKSVGSTSMTAFGWCSAILPQLDQSTLQDALRMRDRQLWQVLNATPEIRECRAVLAVMKCPSDPGGEINTDREFVDFIAEKLARANYVGSYSTRFVTHGSQLDHSHPGGVFWPGSAVRISCISDGTSQTLLAGERGSAGHSAVWIGTRGYLGPNRRGFSQVVGVVEGHSDAVFGSDHPYGWNGLFCDGSVHFVSVDMDRIALDAMATRSGGETH